MTTLDVNAARQGNAEGVVIDGGGVAAAGEHRPSTPLRMSVVVPTRGRPTLLLGCLEALARQTLPAGAFEILVVDDGTDDTTRSLVEALSRNPGMPTLRYLRTRRTQGPAAARNTGWREAYGEVVAFTDDDAVPADDWLERGESAMRAGPWAALGGRVQVPLPPQPTDPERRMQRLERSEFVTANAFVTRRALQQVQGFDERFTRAWREDSDLQFRLQDEVGPVGRCEDAVVMHPARRERWGASLRQQRNAFFEALLFAKHPRRFVAGAGLPPPWDHYAVVALSLGALWLWMIGIWGSAVVSGTLALLLVLRLTVRRLRGNSKRLDHVLETLLTSAAIPFLSVYWRLRGALHFRVWFL
jgi:glycosyltransferase involved in cell wall biosynthesis